MPQPSAFSLYASNFLSRSVRPASPGSESPDSPPLFYSVTEGSHLADSDRAFPSRNSSNADNDYSDVDDDGQPRLRGALLFDAAQEEDRLARSQDQDQYEYEYPADADATPRAHEEEVVDPFLDDHGVDHDPSLSEQDLDSIPLIASFASSSAHTTHTINNNTHIPPSVLGGSTLPQSQFQSQSRGWLSHLQQSHIPPVIRHPSPPPLSPLMHSPRSASPDFPGSPASSDDSLPPDYLQSRNQYQNDSIPPPPPRTQINLEESLLPRDGIERSVFSLPDPDRPVPRRKYNDSAWTALWCAAVTACAVGSVLVLFLTDASPKPPSHQPAAPPPYKTLTRQIPFLVALTLFSSALSYAYLFVLRLAVRPMIVVTALLVPTSLFLAGVWAFAASFFGGDGELEGWGQTVGLRIFSIVPLGFAFLSARSLYFRREAIYRTVSVVELSTTLLLAHPPLILLSLSLLLASIILSLPFLSLILRLLLVGYFQKNAHLPGTWSWHVRAWAGWMAFGAAGVWVWSWGVVRGVVRAVVGGVVGGWYFGGSPESTTRKMSPVDATRAAFVRATGPSLGSVCLGAVLLALIRWSLVLLRFVRRMTTPAHLIPLSAFHPLTILAGMISVLDSLSAYGLVYVGVTGEGFWVSARRARELTGNGSGGGRGRGQEEEDGDSEEGVTEGRTGRGRGGRRGRGEQQGGARRGRVARVDDYALLSTLQTLLALSLAVLAAIAGYIFASHSLAGPSNAPLAALLTGGVTYLTVGFGMGLSEDAADALYLCYKLDIDAGVEHKKEVGEAFEGRHAIGEV
ncbi:hypothetical protein BOTBODRAFT_190664 [Botryobasidium botryosum FD-172 SS1]|uniref:Protein PNS1 n=1 Tax=Botryobasidium botryosum (strain FD-172 SS1) TaxID=930990 RepID=A0A067MF31_BOTB1|nr:hypothetical protein BOTBODRAFT_190664 [Botryobasidium botryosum FD-172 SS1]